MPVSLGDALNAYQNSGASEVNAKAIGTIGPYTSTLSSPVAATQQYNAASTTPSSQSGLAKAGHFIGGLATGIGHLAEGATKFLATTTVHMATAVPREVIGISHAFIDNSYINWNNQRTSQNSAQLSALSSNYKAGKINKSQYQLGLKELISDNNNITRNEQGLINRINSDKTDAYKAMTDSAAMVATILTAGVGELSLIPAQLGEKTAAEYLGSTAAKPFMDNVERGLNQFANDPAAFGKLNLGMQVALQKASAEVISQASGSMTAEQIARASAVNLALKYPLYYSYLSSTGHEIYQQLDQRKFEGAIRTTAFNALLMLSGGPIGQALKYGGKALGGIAARTFTSDPFITELSKGIHDGNPLGIENALVNGKDFSQYRFFDAGKLNTLPTGAAQARIAQNLRALAATNLRAVPGKDQVSAAWRVLTGMASYEGLSMKSFSHEEALLNMSNFAEAQRAADYYGRDAGLNGVTVGRVSALNLQKVSKELSVATSKKAAHTSFDNMITDNPTQAWANNTNFINQIHSLIDKHGPGDKLTEAMGKIKAQFVVRNFPKSVAKELSSMGYLPIQPTKLEAPFTEGAAGKMASSFTEGNKFFEKTVQPLPVLGHIGALLQMSGLSPMAAEGRLYQMYNAALTERLTGMDFIHSSDLKGDTVEHTTDNLVKRLSNWTNQLNAGTVQRGGIRLAEQHIRPPVNDIKQLMVKDIAAALKINNTEAKQVSQALRNAAIDVPLAVRGLGDRLVDVASQIPLFRSYLRAQGAGKFAWNPIFQGKLITKTELASQALSGGKLPVGLDNVLGKGPEVESTRGLLRLNGIFDVVPGGGKGRTGGEFSLEGSAVSSNLSHKLLDTQERSIAGMVNKMAAKSNLTPAQFVEQFPNETRDTVKMIAGYDRGSDFLHSPLIRTLNYAFFPFRFEYKVASIMAKSLAQTDTMTQVAVINGLMNAHNWLNSPEGMAWYSQNSGVLKFINYFSPTSMMSTVGTVLSGVSHEDWKTTVGAFELGGLPFGWIPQILNDEGANFSPGYVDPTTGNVLPHQIPNTDKARFQTAISDLVGSLFTYPGSEIGLPSKSSVDKFIAGGAVGGKVPSSQYTPTQPYLGAQQQKYSQTLQGQAQPTKGTVQSPTEVPSSAQVKIAGSGEAAPVYKSGGPKVAKAKSLKKGQFKASLPL